MYVCGISKMVGPKKQDFWPRINILEGKKSKKKFCFGNFFQHMKKISQFLDFCKYQGGKI
jgi:hypothetical protein